MRVFLYEIFKDCICNVNALAMMDKVVTGWVVFFRRRVSLTIREHRRVKL
jgi:hypothetical protein